MCWVVAFLVPRSQRYCDTTANNMSVILTATSTMQVVGPPGVGKSQFCMMLAAQCVTRSTMPTPSSPSSSSPSAAAAATAATATRTPHRRAVLYINTETGFSAARVAEFVEHYLAGMHCNAAASQTPSSNLVCECMQSIIVHQVSTVQEFQQMYAFIHEIVNNAIRSLAEMSSCCCLGCCLGC
jgi:RecA/RadA recombinase